MSHTNGYTFQDVYLVASIVVNVQNCIGRPVIYVPSHSIPLNRKIVKPHIPPSILYKLLE